MGLDMYMDVRRSVYPSMDTEEHAKLKAIMDGQMAGSFLSNADSFDDVIHIGQRVAYWRKANAIHAWFVENVQGGVDECQEVEVSEEDLTKLVAVCAEVLDLLNPFCEEVYDTNDWERDAVIPDEVRDKAEALLTPTNGFFFGSTSIDQWYYSGIRYTYDRLKELLAWLEKERSENRYWSVIYHSSW